MLQLWIRSSLKVGASLPGLVAFFMGLIEASEKGGFDKAEPGLHGKLIYLLNLTLWLLLEHLTAYILLSLLLGAIWAVIVAEPKRSARDSFQKERRKRMKGG